MENNNEQTLHDKNFEKWFNELAEEKKEDIFIHFYSNLRQPNGLLIELGNFWHLAWMFLTLEGREFIEKMNDGMDICEDCAGDMDHDNTYHKAFFRWQVGNKQLMFDLYSYFYSILLDSDGNLMDFEEFMFGLWKFTTLEGRDFHVECEREMIEEHRGDV